MFGQLVELFIPHGIKHYHPPSKIQFYKRFEPGKNKEVSVPFDNHYESWVNILCIYLNYSMHYSPMNIKHRRKFKASLSEIRFRTTKAVTILRIQT